MCKVSALSFSVCVYLFICIYTYVYGPARRPATPTPDAILPTPPGQQTPRWGCQPSTTIRQDPICIT